MALDITNSTPKTDEQVMAQFAKAAIISMNTMFPCTVVKYDAVNMVATLQPLLSTFIYDDDVSGGGFAEELSQLPSVSVAFPRAGNLVMTWPVQVGDECLVYFAHKSCFDALKTGKTGKIQHLDNGNLEDAIAILHQFSIPKHQEVVSPSIDRYEIRTIDGEASISLNDDGTQSRVTVGGTTMTIIDGTITIDGANLVVNGDISATGDITDGGGTSGASGSMANDRDIFNAHVHKENDVGGNTNATLTPQP